MRRLSGQQRADRYACIAAGVSSWRYSTITRGSSTMRCGAVRCDPAAFSIAFAAGVTGLYGKVGGLNARPSRSTNWGKPGASRPCTGGYMNVGGVCGSCRWGSRYRHVWRFAKSARFHGKQRTWDRSFRSRAAEAIRRRFMLYSRAPKAICDRLTDLPFSLRMHIARCWLPVRNVRSRTRCYLMRGPECIRVLDYAAWSVASITNV